MLMVTTREGGEKRLAGVPGLSVMEVIRHGGLDELMALCGGCCSCATCHVYVDLAFVDALPAMSADEDDLLESSSHRTSRSRLACQIRFDNNLDVMRVMIAPED